MAKPPHELGRLFGHTWATRNSPEELANMLQNEPNLPAALERELHDFASTTSPTPTTGTNATCWRRRSTAR